MIAAIGAMTSVLAELQSLAGAAIAPSTSQLVPDAVGGADAAKPSFSDALRSALGQVDASISEASTKATAFAAGDKDLPLSDVMVSLEQANLSLQLASGVRDKVVAAYANIMNMQI
ncbi:MAG TPA: flagellar hook-basal body complex protein FliE [Stellaceae bacterium]|nr:flagellar hook-basal body complex protein FliE [Stellaceae bacterium]